MSPSLACTTGYAASRGVAWECDHVGFTLELELDDEEVTLLSAWVRTGFWLTPAAEKHLLVEAAETNENEGSWAFNVRLRHGSLCARVELDRITCLPMRMELKVCGDMEVWEFSDWGSAERTSGPLYPAEVRHRADGGGVQRYVVEGGRMGPTLPLLESGLPATAPGSLPGAAMAVEGTASVEIERTGSGHILVKPLLDGQYKGAFILDTGASGLVITGKAANALGMGSFGELHVSGVGGKVPSRFRRCDELTLGPLTLFKPLFMEMELRGVVSGTKSDVIGIVGFEVFRQVVVEIPQKGKELLLHHPRFFDAPKECCWQPIQIVANVPHVRARFPIERVGGEEEQGAAEAGASFEQEELFMVDSGAGGADVIFHARSAARLRLEEVLRARSGGGTTLVRGVSGSDGQKKKKGGSASAGLRTRRFLLDRLHLSEGTLAGEELRVLVSSPGAFDLSEHSAGMVCSELLQRSHVILDLPSRRLALLPPPSNDE
mmetsp:Transcript_18682/g.60958  ORF Transcript_18682/g.60958 Transcript_18682/m.60958 type:complete len:491 (+) Transcript_18682:127-1599(+)